ncbi:MAG TPA: tetratricopeptide repeat protein [Kofleriaceae bacterium]
MRGPHPAHADSRAEPTPSTHSDPRAEPTTPEARAHFDRGGKLFGLQDFEGAILEYKQGALIENLPVFDLALGQCYRKLHRYDDALWYFRRFLKYGRPSGNVRRGVEDLVAQMRTEQEMIVQEPARAVPAGSAEHPPVVPQSPPPGTPPRPLAEAAPAAATAGRSDPWYRDVLGLALVSAGTAAASTAGYLAFDGHRLRDDSNTDPVQARRNHLYDESVSHYRLGAAFGIAGASLLVVAVIRLASRPSERTRRSATSWDVGVTGDRVMVFGQF